MVGELERFAVMTENVSQARAVTEFARKYLDHVNHAMMTVNALQVNAIFLSALVWI